MIFEYGIQIAKFPIAFLWFEKDHGKSVFFKEK